MSTSPVPDPDEVDPTGVRELLAALPDPGPMPEDLIRRIEARLEVERAHLGTAGAGGAALSEHADRVVDLATERGRRRPARTMALVGAAAAGLVVTTATLGQWLGATGTSDSGTAAQYPARDSSGAASSDDPAEPESAGDDAADMAGAPMATDAADEADPDSAEAGAQDDEAQDGATATEEGGVTAFSSMDLPLPADVVVLPGLGAVHEDDYHGRLLGLAQDDEADLVLGVGDLTPLEAASCWQGLAPEETFDRYLASRADLAADGGRQEAVALLGLNASGSGTTWVVDAACTAAPGADVLSGPTPVD